MSAPKRFNTTGPCFPEYHYMVEIPSLIPEMGRMVARGDYFCVNRGRQYGKTTTLEALRTYLSDNYTVFFISFEGIGNAPFATEGSLSQAFLKLLLEQLECGMVPNATGEIHSLINSSLLSEDGFSLESLKSIIRELCRVSAKPIVLLIDEVDQAGNFESFLKFLGMLRAKYLTRYSIPTFHCVILAVVYNIRNLKLKFRGQENLQYNSPWNIAVPFHLGMELPRQGIAQMLKDYEAANRTGMDREEMAKLLFDYTSGYPYLVSRLCQIMDEELLMNPSFASLSQCWTRKGFLSAVKILLNEHNTLFDDIFKKLNDCPELKKMLYEMLCHGIKMPFVSNAHEVEIGCMFGFLKNLNEEVSVANIIFETLLYNVFFFEAQQRITGDNHVPLEERSLFVVDGHLNMPLVMKKFQESYQAIYNGSSFLEKDGRMLFLFYLKPIINGVGHYYIEPRTRNEGQMDLVIQYHQERFIVELKIWRGNAYLEKGHEQLCKYLDAMQEKNGYLLVFQFHQGKQAETRILQVGNHTIWETLV